MDRTDRRNNGQKFSAKRRVGISRRYQPRPAQPFPGRLTEVEARGIPPGAFYDQFDEVMLSVFWCERGDSNPHDLAIASPSSFGEG
jgi:hypothetical protein